MIQSSIVQMGDERFIIVVVPGADKPLAAGSGSHANFDAIVDYVGQEAKGVAIDLDTLVNLFDVQKAVAEKFARVSERVTVKNGVVYFDGDPIHSGLTEAILRALEDDEGFEPLVNFFEKIQQNPNDHSREQSYDWLAGHADSLTITDEGDVIGYKGVYNGQEPGTYVSGVSGSAIVDGEPITGKIPNAVGSIIEMPRSEVMHDPSAACHKGLHVGTFDYARIYARGAMLKVLVNPRDIVSVPTDAGGEKIRVCRYKVLDIIDAPETRVYGGSYAFDDGDQEDEGSIDLDVSLDSPAFQVGDRVRDEDGDAARVIARQEDDGEWTYHVEYDDSDEFGSCWWDEADLTAI